MAAWISVLILMAAAKLGRVAADELEEGAEDLPLLVAHAVAVASHDASLWICMAGRLSNPRLIANHAHTP